MWWRVLKWLILVHLSSGAAAAAAAAPAAREKRDALSALTQITRGITRDFNMNMEFQLRKLGIKLDDIGERSSD